MDRDSHFTACTTVKRAGRRIAIEYSEITEKNIEFWSPMFFSVSISLYYKMWCSTNWSSA